MKNDIQIVLIEDSEDDANLTMRSLKKSNLINDIVWLQDGEEAVDYFQGRASYKERNLSVKPKLILLDLKLPKVDGISVLKMLKADPELRNIPVVVMTSSQENTDLEKCYELGVNSYVVKPIDFTNFMNVTREISLYWVLINERPE